MLTIKTKVTSEVEKTIPLPYYCKNNETYYRVTEDGLYVLDYKSKYSGGVNYACLGFYSGSVSSPHAEYIANGKEITYLEFEIALNKTLDFLKETTLSEGALKEAI
jgi:hypothetical protein